MRKAGHEDAVVGPSPIAGLGVFATRRFEQGETVLSSTTPVSWTRHIRCGRSEARLQSTGTIWQGGRVVLMQPPERYINSSCEPNTYVQTRDGVRHVIALRGIEAEDEITYDYIVNCHGGEAWTCRCGASTCRGIVPASYFDLPRDEQRRLVPLLDRWFVEEHGIAVAPPASDP